MLRTLAPRIALLTAFVAALDARAGGADALMRVVSAERQSPLAATLVLAPLPNGDPFRIFQGCERVEVRVRYAPEPFFQRSWTGAQVTRETVRRALDHLGAATGPVRFGFIGGGLPVVAGAPCERRSRGLSFEADGSGPALILSFHDPI